MCRTKTPDDEIVKCGRCGESANPNDGWEHGWPLQGKIDVGFPAQAFGALCGMQFIAEPKHFAWWKEGHPAMTKNDAQHIIFEWKHTDEWRLCYDCQKELLRTIGKFFKIPERVEEIKKRKDC
jgi:hypothetical protein